MSIKVCLCANTLYAPTSGGHRWAYLNWALGLRALGCKVTWLEGVVPNTPVHEAQAYVATLRSSLERYEFAESVALYSLGSEPLSHGTAEGCLDLEAAVDADLLLNMAYGIPPEVVERFRRSALLDIDPGLTQIWVSRGQMSVARHDVYFTIGETVGEPDARFPDCGLTWHYTPPCVALDWWPPQEAAADAPFTTVSQWYAHEWMADEGELYSNDKRSGFLPFLDVPRRTSLPMELALCLAGDDGSERQMLLERGWRVQDAQEVVPTPWGYQRYIHDSRGEFSCVKPSCVRLQNAWISDRTLCYLASGKPAVVRHTGPSRFLPDCAGLFRFRDLQEAVHCLEAVAADYKQQCELARALAEEYFDALEVVGRVLERALA